jgi:hypothetical protein
MSDDLELPEYDERLERLFGELPRESAPEPRELDRLVASLEAEGFFAQSRRRSRRRWQWPLQLAAAAVLLAVGGMGGAWFARRNSLEVLLERTDLSVSDRILLMQRAGSAYVRAANGYAGAVAQTDSTAIEVASRVLLGAAQAVARSNLDGGLTPGLAAALRTSSSPGVPTPPQHVLWF